jgi:hypothetical protein
MMRLTWFVATAPLLNGMPGVSSMDVRGGQCCGYLFSYVIPCNASHVRREGTL